MIQCDLVSFFVGTSKRNGLTVNLKIKISNFI